MQRQHYQRASRRTAADDHLQDALRNLNDAAGMGETIIDTLETDREVLHGIHKGVVRMDNALDRSDVLVARLKRPGAIGPVRVKASGPRGEFEHRFVLSGPRGAYV